MKSEPALFIGIITALLALGIAFGVKLNDTQQDAIKGLAVALLPLLAAVVTRRFVYSPATAQKLSGGVATPKQTEKANDAKA